MGAGARSPALRLVYPSGGQRFSLRCGRGGRVPAGAGPTATASGVRDLAVHSGPFLWQRGRFRTSRRLERSLSACRSARQMAGPDHVLREVSLEPANMEAEGSLGLLDSPEREDGGPRCCFSCRRPLSRGAGGFGRSGSRRECGGRSSSQGRTWSGLPERLAERDGCR